MGQYAEDIIEGICDSSGDYTYRYNKKPIKWIKDEPWEANIRKVRKELAILIKTKLKEYPESSENTIIACCRRFINNKYGSGWRERGACTNDPDQWNTLNSYKNPEFNWNYELNKHRN